MVRSPFANKSYLFSDLLFFCANLTGVLPYTGELSNRFLWRPTLKGNSRIHTHMEDFVKFLCTCSFCGGQRSVLRGVAGGEWHFFSHTRHGGLIHAIFPASFALGLGIKRKSCFPNWHSLSYRKREKTRLRTQDSGLALSSGFLRAAFSFSSGGCQRTEGWFGLVMGFENFSAVEGQWDRRSTKPTQTTNGHGSKSRTRSEHPNPH